MTFEAEGEGTRLTMTSLFPSVEAVEKVKSFGAVELGAQTIDRLVAHLGTL